MLKIQGFSRWNKMHRAIQDWYWFLVLVFSPLLQVITRAKLSEVNIDVEKIKTNIEKQEKLNESINMQINELASLDKIREIADKNGLSYKNNNITSID